MTALPDVPRWYDDYRNYEWYGMVEANDGPYVLYADHVAALAEAERISSKVIADFQRQARTAALREALALVLEREADLLSCHKDDECRAYARIAGVIADDIQYRLIDGGDTHG